MAFSLKKWIGSQLFSEFMDDYNENMEVIEGAIIVDSGDNANGHWVKWADGTMMCRIDNIKTTRTSVNSLRVIWTFPQAFVSPDYSIAPCVIYPDAENGGKLSGSISDVGLLYFRTRYLGSCIMQIQAASGYSWVTDDSVPISIIAWGRWKA